MNFSGFSILLAENRADCLLLCRLLDGGAVKYLTKTNSLFCINALHNATKSIQ